MTVIKILLTFPTAGFPDQFCTALGAFDEPRQPVLVNVLARLGFVLLEKSLHIEKEFLRDQGGPLRFDEEVSFVLFDFVRVTGSKPFIDLALADV